MWCWRKLLRDPRISRRSNQSILKEISPEYSLEELMLHLKLQHFGHLLWRTDWLEKTLMLGKVEGGGEEDDRGWDCWMASRTQWTRGWVNSGSWWWTGKSGVLQPMGWQRVRYDWATELNWTEQGLKTQIHRTVARQIINIREKGKGQMRVWVSVATRSSILLPSRCSNPVSEVFWIFIKAHNQDFSVNPLNCKMLATFLVRLYHVKCGAEWIKAGIKIAGRNTNNLR